MTNRVISFPDRPLLIVRRRLRGRRFMDPIRPVFIVGPSRSGTSITRVLCNQSSSLHIADETHFFEDLQVKLGANRLLNEDQKKLCEDYFLTLARRPYGHDGNAKRMEISREFLTAEAEKYGGTSLAYFMAYCDIQAKAHRKSRWGEKTPRHVFCLERIFKDFPKAQVICLVRDPRASILSYRDWAKSEAMSEVERRRVIASYNIIVASLLWRTAVDTAQTAQKKWGQEKIYLLKYEDLIVQGKTEIERLMTWLNEKSAGNIADIPLFNSSYEQSREASGLSNSSLCRWRQNLTPAEIQTIEYYCGDTLLRYGYEPVYPRRITLGVMLASAGFPWAVIRALIANRRRIQNIPSYLWQRSRALLSRKKASSVGIAQED